MAEEVEDEGEDEAADAEVASQACRFGDVWRCGRSGDHGGRSD